MAEACELYAWTPDVCLQMRATLFFAMLRHGRALYFRKKSREYFDLCRVAQFPHATKQSQEEIIQWYWDNSLTAVDRAKRDDFIREVKDGEAQQFISPSEVLDVFKKRRR